MKTVFLILPRRHSIRYMASSGALNYLADNKDIKLIILTSFKDDFFIKEWTGKGAIIEFIPRREGTESIIDLLVSSSMRYLLSIQYDLATINAKIRMKGRLYHFLYRLLVNLLSPLAPFLRSGLRWLDLNLISAFLDKQYRFLLKKHKPDLVVVHSVFEATAYPVSRAAYRSSIPLVGIVISWDNLTGKGETHAHFNKLIVWGQAMKQQAIAYHGYRENQIEMVGTPQFDFFVSLRDKIPSREDFLKSKNLDPERRLITYTTFSQRVGGNEKEFHVINLIHNSIIKNIFLKPCQLIVRVYEKSIQELYQPFERLPFVAVDYARRLPSGLNYKEADEYFMLNLAATVKYADVVVNFSSTTSIDAFIFDIPTISSAYSKRNYWNETHHFRYLVKSGGVMVAHTDDQLINFINEYLVNPASDTDNRKKALEEQCFRVDGRAGERIANIVLNSLK